MVWSKFGSKRVLGILGAILVLAVVVTWPERASLLAWFNVRGLAGAGETSRDRWVERVVNVGEVALPALIEVLATSDDQPCQNVRVALDRLVSQWGYDDPRVLELATRLARACPGFSCHGQECVFEMVHDWFAIRELPSAPPATLLSACAPLLTAALSADQSTWGKALELAEVFLARPGQEEALAPARELIRAGLRAEPIGVRIRAVQLALRDGLDLLDQVVPLLQDTSPDVRRAAILAVGPADHLVRDESLLPCLHDPDPEVRRLCEAALRGRGLRPEHLHLGRLLTDPSPVVRLEVLERLEHSPDLEPGLWLRRLSHDPSPAVRAGAVRLMSQLAQVDLSDRMDQMARDDPSPTVSNLARFYLKKARANSAAHDP